MSGAQKQSSPVEHRKLWWFIPDSGDDAVCGELYWCQIKGSALAYAEYVIRGLKWVFYYSYSLHLLLY